VLERENQRLRQENERLARALEEQARESSSLLRRLAGINEELSHFAYVVSHDLKAPLRGITLLAEWLCEDYGEKLGPEAKEQIALLQSRVNRMHNLIDGVLQYSRVGRIREDMVAVNLNELMPTILDTVAPPAHIRITVDPDLPTITGEKTRIIQVFQNLLSNAVKFMDKPRGEIHVGCVAEAEYWRFRVADNGPGIDAKHFERIFRIFQTLAPRDEYESTGIGLALVKKIVELYGGRVWVESEVGKGSTFFFTFPQKSEVDTPACRAVSGPCGQAQAAWKEPLRPL
jgi:signal transduction histidine kinase